MRLIDLHTDWLLQYAGETTLYEAAHYASVPQRLAQAEGYLSATWAAIIACYRTADDWRAQLDPWAALAELITRIEAEFCGRLLIGPDDVRRWLDDEAGLCWGMIGIEGFDALISGPADLDRLQSLFERGVRLFQPLYTARNELGGSSVAGDERGLTELGFAFLETLADLGSGSLHSMFDLAHLNPQSAGDALGWFEADPARAAKVVPVYSHGALIHDGYTKPRAITLENLGRLRALGGVIGFSVGPPFYDSAETLRASIEAAAALPFQGRRGFEGIAIGTDFLGVDRTLPGLGNAHEVCTWLTQTFSAETATALAQENAKMLFRRVCGAAS
jgi:membrane dipeptidase